MFVWERCKNTVYSQMFEGNHQFGVWAMSNTDFEYHVFLLKYNKQYHPGSPSLPEMSFI